MKIGSIAALCLAVLIITRLALSAAPLARPSAPPIDGVIVAFEPGVAIASMGKTPSATGLAALDKLNAKFGAKAMRQIFRGKSREVSAKSVDERFANVFRIDLPTGVDAAEAAKSYADLPNVRYAEPDGYCFAFATTPNDPLWSQQGAAYPPSLHDQWDMELIQCPEAWDIQRGSSNVTIAVIDTGIDSHHPDLWQNAWYNDGEIMNNGIDDDGNGYVDDYLGFNFIDNNGDATDRHGHGTHCAGTIGAVGNNSLGMCGINWRCKLMAVKALNDKGSGKWSQIAAAVKYATDEGARVINLSLGGDTWSQTIHDAIRYAHDRNVVICAAAGNDNKSMDDTFPASDNDVITVAASDPYDWRCGFSNSGIKIAVSAPGGSSRDDCFMYNVLSCRAANTDPLAACGYGSKVVANDYYLLAGTSMACPHVAGVAALVLAQHPSWTNEQVRMAIQMRADDATNSGAGFDMYTGFGRLNAYRSVTSAEPMTAYISSPQNGTKWWNPTPITGTACGPNLSYWVLEYGEGVTPSTWTVIAMSSSPIVNGLLGNWVRPQPYQPGCYTLRLRVAGTGTQAAEWRQSFFISGSPVAADDCSTPAVISSLPFIANTDLSRATSSSTDPIFQCDPNIGPGCNTLWCSYTPTSPAIIRVKADSTVCAPFVAVYAGQCGSLVPIACSSKWPPSDIIFAANANTRYMIELGSIQRMPGSGAYTRLSVTQQGVPPAFDDCSTPTVITSLPYQFSGPTSDNSEAANDPAIPCLNNAGYNTVWFSYSPTVTTSVAIDTTGSDYDTVLAVWSGSCGALTPITCNDNYNGQSTSKVSFIAYSGSTYLIEAASLIRGAGKLVLNAAQDTSIPDAFTEIFDTSGMFDLQNTSVTFSPDGSRAFYTACVQPITALPTDPAGGTPVALTDDSFAQVTLSNLKQISLYGNARSSFYIGSNGYITLDSGDNSRSLDITNHFSKRRIAALLSDLNPTAAGSVSWKQLADRAVVTWSAVPQYGTTNSNTFQIEMFFDGRIRISYLRVDALAAVAGLSAGLGTPTGFVESDISQYQRCADPKRALRVLYPNGYDWTEPDSAIMVRWLATGTNWQPGDTVKLEYSPNSGGVWRPIADGAAVPYNAPYFIWNTAGYLSNNASRVRVTYNGDSSVTDTSDADFHMLTDLESPMIGQTPLSDTEDTTGPYRVNAQIYDHMGIKSATLFYSKNGGPFQQTTMAALSDLYEYQGEIPGPSAVGDFYDYYIEAIDGSINGWKCRDPYPNNNRFHILPRQDWFTEGFRTLSIDMAHMCITFTPDGSRSFYSACVERADRLPVPLGTPIALTDNGSYQIPLVKTAFPLYGINYSAIHVGSNGYITFGSGDTAYDPTSAHHFALPRISGLLADLDPAQGGRVTWQQIEDQLVVSFIEVPVHNNGGSNTFQIQLFRDGRIAITFAEISTGRAMIGLSRGQGTPVGFTISDLSRYTRCQSQSLKTIKMLADGGLIDLPNAVTSGVFNDRIYVQDANRTMGLGVFWNGAMPAVGERVRIFGNATTGNGERMVYATSVKVLSQGSAPLPLGLANHSLGGGGFFFSPGPPQSGQQGVTGGIGLSNIGLLVRTWGEVTELGPGEIARWFTLSDGSPNPIRIEMPTYDVIPPKLGDRVAVTGISSCYLSGDSVFPRVLVRTQSDLTPVGQ